MPKKIRLTTLEIQDENKIATKTITRKNGEFHVVGYNAGNRFKVRTHDYSHVMFWKELSDLENDRTRFYVLGNAENGAVIARNKETIAEDDIQFLPVDVDNLELDFPLLTNPEKAAEQARAKLPPPLDTAQCRYQFTSKAGLVGTVREPRDGEDKRTELKETQARVRLIFALEYPISLADAKRILADAEGVDLRVYQATQAWYAAPPIFKGMKDPFNGTPRSGLLSGTPTVALTKATPTKTHKAPDLIHDTLDQLPSSPFKKQRGIDLDAYYSHCEQTKADRRDGLPFPEAVALADQYVQEQKKIGLYNILFTNPKGVDRSDVLRNVYFQLVYSHGTTGDAIRRIIDFVGKSTTIQSDKKFTTPGRANYTDGIIHKAEGIVYGTAGECVFEPHPNFPPPRLDERLAPYVQTHIVETNTRESDIAPDEPDPTPHSFMKLNPVFPTVYADIVRQFHTYYDYNQWLVHGAVIATASGMLGKSLYIVGHDELYFNVWSLTLAASGSGKTTVLNQLRKITNRWDNIRRENIQEREARIADMEGETDKDPDTIRDEKQRLLFEKASMIQFPKISTLAKFRQRLTRGQAGVISHGEFGAFLHNLGRSFNEGFKEEQADMFDVPEWHEYETGDREDFIHRPYYSIAGYSTKEWVIDQIGPKDTYTGYFPRFLVFEPPYCEKEDTILPSWTEPADPRYANAFYNALIRYRSDDYKSMANSIRVTIDNSARPRLLDIGHDIWMFYTSVTPDYKIFIRPFVRRWMAYVLKIACLFEAMAAEDTGDVCLTDRFVDAAYYIVRRSMKDVLVLFKRDIVASLFEKRCADTLRYMEERKGPISYRSIQKTPLKGVRPQDIQDVLTYLLDGEFIENVSGSRSHKSKQTFQLVTKKPTVF